MLGNVQRVSLNKMMKHNKHNMGKRFGCISKPNIHKYKPSVLSDRTNLIFMTKKITYAYFTPVDKPIQSVAINSVVEIGA